MSTFACYRITKRKRKRRMMSMMREELERKERRVMRGAAVETLTKLMKEMTQR